MRMRRIYIICFVMFFFLPFITMNLFVPEDGWLANVVITYGFIEPVAAGVLMSVYYTKKRQCITMQLITALFMGTGIFVQQKFPVGIAVMPSVLVEILVAIVLEKTNFDGKRIKALLILLLIELIFLLIIKL